MQMLIRDLYHRCCSKETRFWLFKLRNPEHFKKLRQVVYPSDKGDFSLAPFGEKQSIFVHITKSAGTSVALSLFGKLPYHYRAWEYRVIFGRRRFNQYFKFAFVRNPWDRLYSAYSYLKGGGWNDDDRAWSQQHLADIDDFEQFVLEWLTPERLYAHIHFWPQSDFICDKHGKPLIDYLGYFEEIQDDFQVIAQKLGSDATLAHTNKSKRAGYQQVYSEAAKQKVAQLYQADITHFGYRFDGHQRMQVEAGQWQPAPAAAENP